MNKNYKIKKQIKFIGVIVVLALNGFVLGNINNSVYTKKASGANLVLALNMVNKSKMGQNNLDRNQANFLIDEEDEIHRWLVSAGLNSLDDLYEN